MSEAEQLICDKEAEQTSDQEKTKIPQILTCPPPMELGSQLQQFPTTLPDQYQPPYSPQPQYPYQPAQPIFPIYTQQQSFIKQPNYPSQHSIHLQPILNPVPYQPVPSQPSVNIKRHPVPQQALKEGCSTCCKICFCCLFCYTALGEADKQINNNNHHHHHHDKQHRY